MFTDPSILQEMKPWRKEVHEIGDRVIGETLVFLDGTQWVCRIGECAIGKLITNAMIYDVSKVPCGLNLE